MQPGRLHRLKTKHRGTVGKSAGRQASATLGYTKDMQAPFNVSLFLLREPLSSCLYN